MLGRRMLAACVVSTALAGGGRLVGAAGPEVTSLLPAGGARGTTVEVALKGKFPSWPTKFWVDRPGLTVSAAEKKGNVSITIDAQTAPGMCWIRSFDAAGVSAPLPFVVGSLAELVEKEPNNSVEQATAVPSSSVVANGRLGSRGDVDHFAVELRQGQTLVASLAGHDVLGAPMDSAMHVVSTSGYQLAFNHDGRGLDPEIVFAAPADGTYVVRLFAFPSNPNASVSYSGGDRYVYRLTLSTTGFVDYPWPLAVTRDRETEIQLVGWNVPEPLQSITIKPTGESHDIADPHLANVTRLAVEPHETLIEGESSSAEEPQSVAVPSTISGRIAAPGDVDVYEFEGKKGQPLELRLESRRLGYPLDATLQVTDAKGKSLSRVDDAGGSFDPLIAISPPADGSYRALVSDLNGHGSPRHVYRLRITPTAPTYTVTAGSHSYTVSPDKPAEVALGIDRQHGFAEEIEFVVTGLPEFVTAAAVKSAAEGETAKAVKLALTSSGGSFSGPIRIEAKASGGLARTATAAIPNHTPRIADLWLTATPAEKKKP